MMTTDIAMIGRLGSEAVAAASLAHTVLFVSFTFGMGLVSAVAPLAAQAFGARKPHLIRRSLRVGLWAALLISLPLMVLRFWAKKSWPMLGQAPMTAHLAQEYLARSGLDHPACPLVPGDPRLHERDQPAGTDPVDHAGRDPDQCAAGLSLAVWRVRPAAARPVRRGAGDLHRQSRHVPGGRVVRRVPPAVREVSRVRRFLAHRLETDVATHRHRFADLALLPA